MKITEICITLRHEEKLKAFANITFDNCLVVHGVKVIHGPNGYFVSMPSRKRDDGTYRDIAHPTTAHMRKVLEESVLEAYAAAFAGQATAYLRDQRDICSDIHDPVENHSSVQPGRLKQSG